MRLRSNMNIAEIDAVNKIRVGYKENNLLNHYYSFKDCKISLRYLPDKAEIIITSKDGLKLESYIYWNDDFEAIEKYEYK